jgi:hypothetical protein
MSARPRSLPGLLLALGVGGAASFAAAQPATPGSYALTIPAASFTVESSSQTYDVDFTTLARFPTGAVPEAITVLTTGLTLPSGAIFDQISFEVYDNDPAADVEAQYFSCLGPQAGGICLIPGILETNGQPGWQWLSTGEIGWTSDNINSFFVLRVILPVGSGGGSTKFRRAVAYYHLQVSPAPGTATFNDVPTDNPYFQFVEAVYAAGITAGCGGGDFCPDSPVTRGQMAVFLAKALGLYSPTVPVN